ncbi:MAG: O-methyltransferase, partial [Promicromonosporaceae bacterium]|nr:O-methyltransferase [Promicromonosporaceae bacterium]
MTFEIDKATAEVATGNLECAGVAGQVEVVVGPALDAGQRLIDDGVRPFDFVFIDADKPNYP